MTEHIVDQPANATEDAAPTLEAESLTFEEFMARYEGQPYEWHAGKVVKKVSNNKVHQLILGFLYRLIVNYLELKELGEVFLDGYSMYVSDTLPARQPDLMVILSDRLENAKHQRFEGAADIAVEVVSPASAAVDRGEKLEEYEQAGVREYWLIDPIREEAVIYALHEDGHYRRAPLEGEKLVSTLLPGFRLDPALLWRDAPPKGREIQALIETMID